MTSSPALDEYGLPPGCRLHEDWEVSPRQVQVMRQAKEDFVLIDCRLPWEYERVHIEGAALHVLQQIQDELDEIVEDYTGQKVVVYCHHGQRSFQMTAFLRQAGLTDTWSMAGGIDLWALDIEPTMQRY